MTSLFWGETNRWISGNVKFSLPSWCECINQHMHTILLSFFPIFSINYFVVAIHCNKSHAHCIFKIWVLRASCTCTKLLLFQQVYGPLSLLFWKGAPIVPHWLFCSLQSPYELSQYFCYVPFLIRVHPSQFLYSAVPILLKAPVLLSYFISSYY